MISSEINQYYSNQSKVMNSKPSIFFDKKDKAPSLNITRQNKFGNDLDWGRSTFFSNKNAILNCAFDILVHFYNEDIAEEFCFKFAKEMLMQINISIFVLTQSDVDRWLVDVKFRV